MKCAVFSIEFFVVLIFFCLLNASAEDKANNLKKLSNYNSKTPHILLLVKKTVDSVRELNPDNNDVKAPDISPVDPPHDQKYYNLYAALRVSLITTGPDWLYLLSEGQGEGPLVYTAGSEIQIFASNGISIPTAQGSEDIDDEAHNVFEKTKDVLREALRSRCNRLDTCVQKCPQKKKYTCTLTCKEIIDDYNVCENPKKNECKKPKCGKTMPPSWLLRN